MSDEIEATIIIEVRKGEDRWSSTHALTNIDPLVAAVIMMDVGRDLILAHALHTHSEPLARGSGHAAKGAEHGDAPAAG